MTNTDNTESNATSGATSGTVPPARFPKWSVVTIASILLGLASALFMTVAMFWIGAYYRGSPLSDDAEARRKLQELRASEQKELETYGWVNRTEGVVRLPIDRAMQLLVEEAEGAEAPSAAPTPAESSARQRP